MVGVRGATFDCYGSLIDWDGDIGREFARLLGERRAEDRLRASRELRRELAADGKLSDRGVFREVLHGLGAPVREQDVLACALPRSRLFPVRTSLRPTHELPNPARLPQALGELAGS